MLQKSPGFAKHCPSLERSPTLWERGREIDHDAKPNPFVHSYEFKEHWQQSWALWLHHGNIGYMLGTLETILSTLVTSAASSRHIGDTLLGTLVTLAGTLVTEAGWVILFGNSFFLQLAWCFIAGLHARLNSASSLHSLNSRLVTFPSQFRFDRTEGFVELCVNG